MRGNNIINWKQILCSPKKQHYNLKDTKTTQGKIRFSKEKFTPRTVKT